MENDFIHFTPVSKTSILGINPTASVFTVTGPIKLKRTLFIASFRKGVADRPNLYLASKEPKNFE